MLSKKTHPLKVFKGKKKWRFDAETTEEHLRECVKAVEVASLANENFLH